MTDFRKTITLPVLLVSFSGPYAVGKDTIINHILDRHGSKVARISTLTTRASDPAIDPSYTTLPLGKFQRETEGTDTYVVNWQTESRVGYATSLQEIEEVGASRLGIHSIFPGPDGAGKLRSRLGDQVCSIGVIPPGSSVDAKLQIVRDRLVKRNRDDADTLKRRLADQRSVLQYIIDNQLVTCSSGARMQTFDTVLVNDDLESCLDEVDHIVDPLVEEKSSAY